MIGTTLAHYRVLKLLGRGGMGEVYAAEDTKLRRRVAIKVLPREMAAEPERRRRFEREAQAVAALNHPGIVTIYSVEQHQGIAFLTMELVEGRTLAEAVPPNGMPLAEFLRSAILLADAVNAAHERGILHRDLKPGNVMLTPDGRVKVLDFGVAKLIDRAQAAGAVSGITTSAGQIVGTVSYMAPEQAEGKPSDHRADIFSVGVLLYEMAAGVRPFPGETNVSIVTGLLRDTPRPLTEIRRELPAVLAAIVQKCLEKDPAQRYESAAALRSDLEALRSPVVHRLKSPAPRWAYAASAVFVLLAAAVGWWTVRAPVESRVDRMTAPVAEVPILVTGDRIAILDFENRTGDPRLDEFGRMMSEAIAAGLVGQGLTVASAAEASANDGLTLTGAYYAEGGRLRFEGRVLAASRGTVVRAVDPIVGSRSSVAATVDEAQRRVVAAVLSTLKPASR